MPLTPEQIAALRAALDLLYSLDDDEEPAGNYTRGRILAAFPPERDEEMSDAVIRHLTSPSVPAGDAT